MTVRHASGSPLAALLPTTSTAEPAHGLPASAAAIRVELLISFAVLAQELHFTRAAQVLHLSQSGLSRRVSLLERCLGVVLLDRTSRQVALTDAGRRVLPHALAVLDSLRAVAGIADDEAALLRHLPVQRRTG